jgi:hypothetical protein
MSLHSVVEKVSQRIIERSKPSRQVYLQRVEAAHSKGTNRSTLSCGNLAHGFAAFEPRDKLVLREQRAPNLAIVSSLNYDFRFAYYLLSELEEIKTNNSSEKLKIEYTRALIDLISRKEHAIEKIKNLALRDHLALITLNRMNHIDSLKIKAGNDNSVLIFSAIFIT